ncbi:MAG: TIGR03915 family putative DNA repair protein [Oscillospiraceae bacterium]|nr:TIGR03915 family putative DNA repair protein [Oscillospiraceae bacterium]
MCESDVIYLYDGSLAGLYSVVYHCVYSSELPLSIIPENESEPSMMEQKYIETDNEKAIKVRVSIPKKISPGALTMVEDVFLSCMKEKELPLLKFLLLGYEKGAAAMTMLGHVSVAPLLKAQRHLHHEAHLLKGFIRFTDYGGRLIAEITPKNFVLPYISDHFVERFPNEEFLIYDKTHKTAFIYQGRQKHYAQIDGIEYEADETEKHYQALWKHFYNTVAIQERYNPKCRMSHCAKRYWENMVEMKDFI